MKMMINKKFLISLIVNVLLVVPVLALDLDSTVNDSGRKTYSSTSTVKPKQEVSAQPKTEVINRTEQQVNIEQVKQETAAKVEDQTAKPVIKQDLPTVPALPAKASSSTVAPINTVYSGKVPNSEALIPCTDIKVCSLIVDKSALRSKSKIANNAGTTSTRNYRTAKLSRGTQLRVINKSRISDTMTEGQTISFVTTQELATPYFTIPKNTALTARVVDSHRPQMTCNGGLVGVRVVSANINGYNQQINAGIVRLESDSVYFSNLKGRHTYGRNVNKKAKWGRNMFSKWSQTSHELANKGPCIILSPFPYIGGCLLVAASTVTAPATALLGTGESLVIQPNTTFTIKLYEDAQIRY